MSRLTIGTNSIIANTINTDENNLVGRAATKNIGVTNAGNGNKMMSRSNRPLANITNNIRNKNHGDEKDKKKATKATTKNKASKRPFVEDVNGEKKDENEQKNKKRKSDPMIIDEEPSYENIDINDVDDPQSVVEYVNEIYVFMMEKEQQDKISAKYMSNQADVNEKMRAILVDWLVEVHKMFKLLPETLFLTVNLIDKFLEAKSVAKDKLQLVGITSMLIASKYEEIYAPECNDFVYISDGAYTKDQILKMEQLILNTLNFNLTTPSPLHFLRRYSKAAGSDYTIHTLCKYLIELMLIDVKLLKFPASQIAAGSVYIARVMTGKTPFWTTTLQHYSTYSEDDVRVCATEMNELLKKAQKSSLKAIRKKYSLQKYGQVASIPLVDI